MRVVVRPDRTVRGGNYFGKIPLYRKSEIAKMMQSGVRKVRIGRMKLNVSKYDPKPYTHVEYWECATCYRK